MGGSCLAFTLAEVLIVLGIIGLIADMTIPTIVSSTQEKVAVVRLKKMHSTLESAFRSAVQENGTPDSWDFKDWTVEGSDDSYGGSALDKILPYLRLMKNCPDGKCEGRDKIVLADGSQIIREYHLSKNCNFIRGITQPLKTICAEIFVDINGDNKPNERGRDIFGFYITKYGMIPFGSQAEQNSYTYEFTRCLTMGEAGVACTAWVIYNGNMDYLHCKDLAWGGKTTCK